MGSHLPGIWRSGFGPMKYAAAVAAVALVTSLLAPAVEYLNPTIVALALLLVILVIATVFGSRPALLSSILCVLAYNFFFLPPLYTFTIADLQNWVAFFAFMVTSLIAGQLSSYARRQAEESEARRIEIERLYNELSEAFERASEVEAAKRSEKLKSALLDAISHDLRTPLTSIKASASSLLESYETNVLDKETELEFLQIIIDETDRLNNFIQSIVNAGKVETNSLQTIRYWVSVQDIVSVATERARDSLASRSLLLDFEDNLPAIRVSAGAISEALYLLLDNAAKYSPDGSVIRIAVHQGSGFISLHIDDQGKGIPIDLQGRVFEKFFRGNGPASPSTSQGIGIGLSIARGLIESHGGSIWIEDPPEGFNTRFSVVIPIGEEDDALDEPQKSFDSR